MGVAFVKQVGANVHVLAVADVSIATSAGYSGDSPSIQARLPETGDERATALAEDPREYGLDAKATVREGVPASEIVAKAAEDEIDAVVIGTVGRGGVTRALVGSVADMVIRTAPVPVVTVNPSAAGSQESESGIERMS